MAQKVQVLLTSDLSGGPADETIVFGLDGSSYELDLSKGEAVAFREELEKYTNAARRISGRKRNGRTSKTTTIESDVTAIRAWAQANGIPVNSRGRVSAEVRRKFAEAQQ